MLFAENRSGMGFPDVHMLLQSLIPAILKAPPPVPAQVHWGEPPSTHTCISCRW